MSFVNDIQPRGQWRLIVPLFAMLVSARASAQSQSEAGAPSPPPPAAEPSEPAPPPANDAVSEPGTPAPSSPDAAPAPSSAEAPPAPAPAEPDEAAAANPAAGDVSTGVDPALGAVIISARRRNESVQEVPVAVNVLSGGNLEEKGAVNLQSFHKEVPSVTSYSSNARNTTINIRGLGTGVTSSGAAGLDSGVGFYVDDVYYGRLSQSILNLIDLDRIEVLRGPQGTLFGRNTTAGAISVRGPSAGPSVITSTDTLNERAAMERRQYNLRSVTLAGLALLLSAAACKREAPASAGPKLGFDAPIPAQFPRETQLSLGDPQVKKQLQLMGELDKLPFTASWANISGGPNTIEAYRAGALDGGSVGDTPPIHAAFTGLDVKIIMVNMRDRPIYQLATAPGSEIQSLSDLRGKRIGYSPGQAMGALIQRVLKKAGLSQRDVTLVELNGSEYRDALVGRQIDVAPLASVNLVHYLHDYGPQGARALKHGVKDSLSFFYVQSSVLEDAHKAAALQAYVRTRARTQLWAAAHPEQWAEHFYVRDQGLNAEQARDLVEKLGSPQYPSDWSEAIAMTQDTVDMMAQASGRPSFDAHKLFDRRFERLAAGVAAETRAQLTLPKGVKP